MLTISVVEGERLKELIPYLEPKYVMPLRATVTRAGQLAMTTDCWTALTNKSYITAFLKSKIK